ncbi:TPA: sortase, partial [Enterococcus faecium]|nr:sortase [Enterococcus faecium]
MIKKNEMLWNPYVGVVIVFVIFSYFAYQGYQKGEIAKKASEVTENLVIHTNARSFHDDLAILNDVSNRQLIANQKKALNKNFTEEIVGKLVFSSTGYMLPVFQGANSETLSLGVASTYY